MKTQLGVNLLELLIVIVIIAIASTLAVPAMRGLLQNTRATGLTTDFTSTLAFARTEAIKRGMPVTVCAASDTTHTACGSSVANWTNGWITFVDANGDGSIANGSDRLDIHDSLAGGAAITAAQARVTFQSSGFVSVGVGNYTLSATGCTGNYARRVQVESTGRTAVSDVACP